MVPWQDIDSVFLDMDGTLLDLHFDNHFWREHVPLRYAELRTLDIDSARAELVPRFRSKEGTLEWYCTDYWSRELGLDILALKREIHHLIAIHDHVAEFLEHVRTNGRRVVLVTNAHAGSIALKMEVTGLRTAFDAVVCSHDLGYPKEDRRFWSALTRIEPFDCRRTLFIDDSLPVLRAAHDYGIHHLLAVNRPDSRSPARAIDEFPSIGGFHEIMPEPPPGHG